jgi:hypothetical protein
MVGLCLSSYSGGSAGFFVGLASEAVMMLVDGNFFLGKLVWNGKSPLIRGRLILAKYKGGKMTHIQRRSMNFHSMSFGLRECAIIHKEIAIIIIWIFLLFKTNT